MDQARYVVAMLMIVTLPPAIGAWYLIHPLARFWRRLGTMATFSIVYSPLVSAGLLLFLAEWRGADSTAAEYVEAQKTTSKLAENGSKTGEANGLGSALRP